MNVLLLNHTAQVSGAERVLLTLISNLPDEVRAHVACPPGPLADAVHEFGVPVHGVPGTVGSLKLHPLHTPRAVVDIARSAFALRRIAREVEADVVHANSVRAGLIAVLAAALGAPRPLVHLHDRLPAGRLSSATLWLISRQARGVLVCSKYVGEQIEPDGRTAPVRVIHNSVDLERFDPERISRTEARKQLGLAPANSVLAMIAQFTPWKAQDDAIRMVARVAARYSDARLLLVGSPKFLSAATRYDNSAFTSRLHELVEELGVSQFVDFLGERDDVPEIMRAVDVVLVPSWHEPFGMAIIEAMAMGVAVIATNEGGASEIITHDRDGLLLPPRSPELWATQIERLLESPEWRARMGRLARQRVMHELSVSTFASQVLSAYRDASSAAA